MIPQFTFVWLANTYHMGVLRRVKRLVRAFLRFGSDNRPMMTTTTALLQKTNKQKKKNIYILKNMETLYNNFQQPLQIFYNRWCLFTIVAPEINYADHCYTSHSNICDMLIQRQCFLFFFIQAFLFYPRIISKKYGEIRHLVQKTKFIKIIQVFKTNTLN